MLGRLLTKAPWVFHYVDQFFYEEPCSSQSRYDIILKYVDFCEEMERQGRRESITITTNYNYNYNYNYYYYYYL